MEKYLRFVLDSKPSWKPNIKKRARKALIAFGKRGVFHRKLTSGSVTHYTTANYFLFGLYEVEALRKVHIYKEVRERSRRFVDRSYTFMALQNTTYSSPSAIL